MYFSSASFLACMRDIRSIEDVKSGWNCRPRVWLGPAWCAALAASVDGTTDHIRMLREARGAPVLAALGPNTDAERLLQWHDRAFGKEPGRKRGARRGPDPDADFLQPDKSVAPDPPTIRAAAIAANAFKPPPPPSAKDMSAAEARILRHNNRGFDRSQQKTALW